MLHSTRWRLTLDATPLGGALIVRTESQASENRKDGVWLSSCTNIYLPVTRTLACADEKYDRTRRMNVSTLNMISLYWFQ